MSHRVMADKILNQVYGRKAGPLSAYRRLCVGEEGGLFFLRYEIALLFLRNLQGGLGIFLRGIFCRSLFRRAGRKVFIGPGVTLRHPRRIELGDEVILDEGCVLDAKGEGGAGIRLGSRVFVSRQAHLGCKEGSITVGDNVSFGPFAIVHSIDASAVRVGSNVMIAANCYLAGSASYRHERTDVPMAEQGFEAGRGIEIGDDVWIGASTVVLDGARVGRGSIIGAMSLVRGDIPPYSIAYGIPATVRGRRGGAIPPTSAGQTSA
jgi:acetyltransferase-like isoleucine patch superfamily enzyme